MPAIQVSIDGEVVAALSTTGRDVVAVDIGGTRIDEYLATLNVAAGTYPEGGESSYLIWVDQRPLHTGQSVEISLRPNLVDSHPGKSINALYGENPCEVPAEAKSVDELIEELQQHPVLREGFAFTFASSAGTTYTGETSSTDHGFGCSVLWNSHNPEHARVSLRSYTLESLRTRSDGTSHVSERLSEGGSIRLAVAEIGA